MLGIVLVLFFSIISSAHGDCNCYVTGTSGSPAQLGNAFNTDNFQPCLPATPCGFVADSGDDSVGWNNVSITFPSSSDGSGVLTIYNGKDKSLGAIQQLYSTVIGLQSKLISSSSRYIYIEYTQTGTPANTYYGRVVAGGALATTGAPTSTTPAPTTRSAFPSDFIKDPYLISHDLLIVVNQRTSQGIAGLNALNTIATNLVNQLSITNAINSASDTRLSLSTITPYTPFYAVQGDIWNLNASELTAALPKSGVSADGQINDALKALLPIAFNVSDARYPTRRNSQRTILLLTAGWPAENSELDTTVRDAFFGKGVNLAVIGYNLNTTEDAALTKSDAWYNYLNLNGTDLSSVASFVNYYFLSGDVNINKWVPNSNISQTDGDFGFQEPANAGKNQWEPTDGQSGRYCDFQDTTYTYTNSQNKTLTVTVNYELETERDYLRFWADGVEIESFTGIDVNGAKFVTNPQVLTARFTTDNKNVLRGFNVNITQAT